MIAMPLIIQRLAKWRSVCGIIAFLLVSIAVAKPDMQQADAEQRLLESRYIAKADHATKTFYRLMVDAAFRQEIDEEVFEPNVQPVLDANNAGRKLLQGQNGLLDFVDDDSVHIVRPFAETEQPDVLLVLAPGAGFFGYNYEELIFLLLDESFSSGIDLWIATLEINTAGLFQNLFVLAQQDKEAEFVKNANEYIDALFHLAIDKAEEQNFNRTVSAPGVRFNNVFVVGHSNGGVLLQTPAIEREASGIIFLASLKLYNDGNYWNDVAQASASIPIMFLSGIRDCVTESTMLVDPALAFTTVANTIDLSYALQRCPVVAVPGLNHYVVIDDNEYQGTEVTGDCQPTGSPQALRRQAADQIVTFMQLNTPLHITGAQTNRRRLLSFQSDSEPESEEKIQHQKWLISSQLSMAKRNGKQSQNGEQTHNQEGPKTTGTSSRARRRLQQTTAPSTPPAPRSFAGLFRPPQGASSDAEQLYDESQFTSIDGINLQAAVFNPSATGTSNSPPAPPLTPTDPNTPVPDGPAPIPSLIGIRANRDQNVSTTPNAASSSNNNSTGIPTTTPTAELGLNAVERQEQALNKMLAWTTGSFHNLNSFSIELGAGNLESASSSGQQFTFLPQYFLSSDQGIHYRHDASLGPLPFALPLSQATSTERPTPGNEENILTFLEQRQQSALNTQDYIPNSIGAQQFMSGFAGPGGALQQYVALPWQYDLARQACVQAQSTMLRGLDPSIGVRVSCLAYTDIVAYKAVQAQVSDLPGDVKHVIAHVLLVRPGLTDIEGSLAAQVTPQYWFTLVSCDAIDPSCSSDPTEECSIDGCTQADKTAELVNTAYYRSALTLLPAAAINENRANGVELRIGACLHKDSLEEWFKFPTQLSESSWLGGIRYVDNQSKAEYRPEVFVDQRLQQFRMKSLSIGSIVEWILIQGNRSPSYTPSRF